MKTKIFKLLSVVMALAMVFTMFACVAHADEATTQDVIVAGVVSPALASGTVNGNDSLTLDTCVGKHDIRLYTVNTYLVADYEDVIVGEGCRVFVQFWKEDGSYNKGGSGWLFAGTHKIASMSNAGGATYFKITFDSADGTTTPPVDGLKITLADKVVDGVVSPVLASGTVNGNDSLTLDTCVGTHAVRLYTVKTYKVADYQSVIVGENCRVFVQFWKEDGSYNKGGSGWLQAGTHEIATMGNAAGATYFKITFDSADGATTPPAEGLKLVQKAAAPEFTPSEGDTYADGIVSPLLGSGTVNGVNLDAANLINKETTRLYTVNTYKVADYETVILTAADCRVFVQFFKADGTYNQGSGWLTTGTYKIAEMNNAKGADLFKITYSSTLGGNDVETPPSDGLKLGVKVGGTTEPETPVEPEVPEIVVPDAAETHEMAQGNIIADKQGEIQANNDERIHTKDLLAIENYTAVTIGEGFKAWFHVYDATGTWIGHIGKWTTGKTTLRMSEIQAISDKAVYFRAAVGRTSGKLAAADFPADGLVFTLPVNPVMEQGNIIADKQGEIQANNDERIYTKDLLPLADYTYLTIANGYKTWLHVYDANGNWIGHIGKWTTGEATVKMAELMKINANAVYFRAAVGKTSGKLAVADFPAGTLKLYQAPAPVLPEFTQGTIDKGTIHTGSTNRIHTTASFGLGDYERVTIASGYKVFFNFYNAEGTWVNNFGWKEGTIKVADIKKAADKTAVSYKLVIGPVVDGAITPETVPADVAKLYVVGSSGACVEHDVPNYTSNNDAKCLEDGTKTGYCSVCGEAVTIADQYSAPGHKFTDDADTDCDVCGEARVAQDTCTHKYGEYASNNDATCEENGTKSATCLICGKVDTVVEENTAKGHTVDYKYNNDATCTEDGTQSGVCSVCNKDITVPVVGTAKGHTYDGMDDFSCNVCFTERKTYNFFASESRLGGADNNDGLSAATPVLTVNKVIDLANAAGAAEGDIVKVTLTGTVEFGNATTTDIAGLDLNTHKVMSKHNFVLVLTSEDGTATLKFNKNLRMGGPTVFDNVTINTDTTWQYFAFGGHSFTLNADFGRNEIDGSFGQGTIALDIRKVTNITFNGFMRKFSLGNAYNDVNFYENYNINFTHMNENPGEGYYFCFGGIQQGNTIIHKGLNIVNTGNEPFTFAKGTGLVLKDGAYFNFINNFAGTTINLADLGLSAETAAKTWVLNNIAPNGKVTYTDVAGEFKVSTGYIATATPLEGAAITSVAGKLTLPAGQYTIELTACADHVYDDDTDATCNNCGAVREVYIACEHEWGEYVFDNNATCTDLGTETAVCGKCGEEDNRPVAGVAPGHQYDEAGYCTGCGIYEVTEPTMVKEADGKWYYYQDGYKLLQTTLIKYSGKWFYLEDGEWDKTVTTLVKYSGKWFYVKNGKWDSKITNTLVKYNGKWFWIKGGKWDSSFTNKLVDYSGKKFYIKGGKWDSSINDIVTISGTKYLIKSGKWSKTTTLFKKSGKYYAIKSGKVTTSKVIIKYNGKKYYCYKGYAQTSFSGKVTISGKKYTVKKGIIK